MKDLATATGTAAGQVVEQGSPAVEDPEATACIQQLESLLELERGLREGAEMQVASYKKLTHQAVAASYKKRLADPDRIPAQDQGAAARRGAVPTPLRTYRRRGRAAKAQRDPSWVRRCFWKYAHRIWAGSLG